MKQLVLIVAVPIFTINLQVQKLQLVQVIMQDVQKVFPGLVYVDEDGMKK